MAYRSYVSAPDRARVLWKGSRRSRSIVTIDVTGRARNRSRPNRVIAFDVLSDAGRKNEFVRAISGSTLEANRDQRVAICSRSV